MFLKLGLAALTFAALAFSQAADTPFQVSYVTNLGVGDSTLTFTNDGASSTVASPQNGQLCANVYVLNPSSTLLACCSCVVGSGQLKSLNVKTDIKSTGISGSSLVVKVLTSVGTSPGVCNPQTVATGANVLATGLISWNTTQSTATAANNAGFYFPTRINFTPSTLSAAELTTLNTSCTNLGGTTCAFCRNGSQ